MEHAATAIATYVAQNCTLGSKVLVVAGSGNNGADGIAVARLLEGDFSVELMLPYGVGSKLTELQFKRATATRVEICSAVASEYSVVVDALFGSGLSRELDLDCVELIETLNSLDALKIACDVPTGVNRDGLILSSCFKADVTITMGALNRSLFSDMAKDMVGEIVVASLGVSRSKYEVESNWKLLDRSDLKLPYRDREDVHKGSFGHLGVVCSAAMSGAAIISAKSALKFGAGLVTLLSHEQIDKPYEIMCSYSLPPTLTAIAVGMGLGCEHSLLELGDMLSNTLPLLLDADMFEHPMLLELLKRKNVVITPHPKEFVKILKRSALAKIDTDQLQKNRFFYVQLFSQKYPNITLLLKGANVIIAQNDSYYINPHGTSVLAKGGSGDVLSGMIGALLAQGYSPLHSAIHGSLAHTQAALSYSANSFSLSPSNLIDALESI